MKNALGRGTPKSLILMYCTTSLTRSRGTGKYFSYKSCEIFTEVKFADEWAPK